MGQMVYCFGLQCNMRVEKLMILRCIKQMEQSIKKKTKNLIALKTNNFIDSQINKERFFSHLLQTLQTQLTHQQFTFLTTYLIFHQNITHKKNHHQAKYPTPKRIVTLPDEKAFNLCQIDPDLFHDKPMKQQNNVLRTSSPKIQQIDFNCTNTPKKKTKYLIFENKRIMDLDKRLNKKYQTNQNLIVHNPKIFDFEKQNKTEERYFIKTAYQNSLKRTNGKELTRRLKTSFTLNRDKIEKKPEGHFDFENSFFNKRLKNGEMNEGYPSQRLRKSENSIPKYLLEQVILSRRYNKMDRSCNDFSDFKLSSRYKDCFS